MRNSDIRSKRPVLVIGALRALSELSSVLLCIVEAKTNSKLRDNIDPSGPHQLGCRPEAWPARKSLGTQCMKLNQQWSRTQVHTGRTVESLQFLRRSQDGSPHTGLNLPAPLDLLGILLRTKSPLRHLARPGARWTSQPRIADTV
mmetsp:Transcript_14824/g.23082  ORF Transcript_14824/g.23082 Transcript_14824/m.23082 type:complete len:145 (+) Transcript_14824:57-491(+)